MIPEASCQRPSGDASADSVLNHDPSLLITFIHRDHIPEDLRWDFLPGDIILINKPESTHSAVRQTLAEVQRLGAPDLECAWCGFTYVYMRLIAALAGLVFLGTFAVWLLWGNVLTACLTAQAFVYAIHAWCLMRRARTMANESVDRRCLRDAKRHRLASLAARVLSPGSLLLLRQPKSNLRSFIRYHQFFTGARGKIGEGFHQEVDSCIRHCAAQGGLPTEALAGTDTQALLGLQPYQGSLTHVGFIFPRAFLLYRSYRDWKRWRLANMVCERVWAGEIEVPPLSTSIDGQNPLDGYDCCGDRNWFLLNPRLFSWRLRRGVVAYV